MKLKICTFNIRLGVVDDGDHHWEKRKELLAQTIRTINPDVLCVQEAYRFQVDFLRLHLAEHRVFGVGREDGVQAGEHAAVLYRNLIATETETIWLSDTPNVPGSRSWDAACTRVATLVTFAENFTVCNTHWDHVSERARERSAHLIREKLVGSMVLCGDFNARPDDVSIRTIGAGLRHANDRLGGTYHGFSGDRDGDMIDHIFCTPDWTILESEVVYASNNGLWPSDHFPVVAHIERDDTIN